MTQAAPTQAPAQTPPPRLRFRRSKSRVVNLLTAGAFVAKDHADLKKMRALLWGHEHLPEWLKDERNAVAFLSALVFVGNIGTIISGIRHGSFSWQRAVGGGFSLTGAGFGIAAKIVEKWQAQKNALEDVNEPVLPRLQHAAREIRTAWPHPLQKPRVPAGLSWASAGFFYMFSAIARGRPFEAARGLCTFIGSLFFGHLIRRHGSTPETWRNDSSRVSATTYQVCSVSVLADGITGSDPFIVGAAACFGIGQLGQTLSSVDPQCMRGAIKVREASLVDAKDRFRNARAELFRRGKSGDRFAA